MASNRVVTFAAWQGIWMVVTLWTALLLWADLQSLVTVLEGTFFVGFIGFLLGVELVGHRHVAPEIWARARWGVAVGGLALALLVLRRIVLILR